MYQDKLAGLKRQLEDLKNTIHPDYVRKVKKLEFQYKERLRINEIYRDYLVECVERDYILEKKASGKEYEEKKADLKENLITDFEDKRKMIESERHSMELTGDTMDVKPTITRKLRRRPNEPIPVAAEKRRKPTTGQLVLLLDDKEVDSDLKLINRGKAMTPHRPNAVGNGDGPSGAAHGSPGGEQYPLVETRIEDGKLLYERRWFHRGQPVYIEGKDMAKFPATISAIGNEVVSGNSVGHEPKGLLLIWIFSLFSDLGEKGERQQQSEDQHLPIGTRKDRHQAESKLGNTIKHLFKYIINFNRMYCVAQTKQLRLYFDAHLSFY